MYFWSAAGEIFLASFSRHLTDGSKNVVFIPPSISNLGGGRGGINTWISPDESALSIRACYSHVPSLLWPTTRKGGHFRVLGLQARSAPQFAAKANLGRQADLGRQSTFFGLEEAPRSGFRTGRIVLCHGILVQLVR